MTEVGEFENSVSPYGTFDQGGNLIEWNETILHGTSRSYRGIRGGSFANVVTGMHAAGRGLANPVACVLSGARMLEWLGARHSDEQLTSAAQRVQVATEAVLADGRYVTPDVGGGSSTSECADAICAELG